MTNEDIRFTLKPETIDNLRLYTEILKKNTSQVIENALEEYFASIQKHMLEKRIEDENMLTNLDYDEFWDGVDI